MSAVERRSPSTRGLPHAARSSRLGVDRDRRLVEQRVAVADPPATLAAHDASLVDALDLVQPPLGAAVAHDVPPEDALVQPAAPEEHGPRAPPLSARVAAALAPALAVQAALVAAHDSLDRRGTACRPPTRRAPNRARRRASCRGDSPARPWPCRARPRPRRPRGRSHGPGGPALGGAGAVSSPPANAVAETPSMAEPNVRIATARSAARCADGAEMSCRTPRVLDMRRPDPPDHCRHVPMDSQRPRSTCRSRP